MLPDHEIEIRVRYYETDAQGFVHHANYFQYFELARVEQLLALGYDYAQLERDGIILVVNKIACKYHRPCKFGDTLRLQIRTVRARARGSTTSTACSAATNCWPRRESTLACIDREGRVQRLPEFLVEERRGPVNRLRSAAQRTADCTNDSRPGVFSGCGLKQTTRPLPNLPRAIAVVPFMTPVGAPFLRDLRLERGQQFVVGDVDRCRPGPAAGRDGSRSVLSLHRFPAPIVRRAASGAALRRCRGPSVRDRRPGHRASPATRDTRPSRGTPPAQCR